MEKAKKQKEVLNKTLNGKKDSDLKFWDNILQAAIEAESIRCCEDI